ncbi:TIGR04500 family putative peptide maturation system protein [Streptosporangium sp. NPDC020072]|uniref:TIGR04500 family putative peptide maturation system protein n=1 Tax=Streptosporangium jomthongense TaxID=1193683 RepID=A0ABV8FDE9_9ACTN
MADGRTLAEALRVLTDGADLGAFRRANPGLRVRLVAQREEFDGSLQHALLLKEPDGSTVSLSWSPDLGLPWPLRGVHRAAEHLLLRVNGVETPVARAVACLDFVWDERGVADRLVTDCLVREALEEEPEPISDAELQRAMDAFRRARGLLTGAGTRAWMERNHISHAELEELVAVEASVARLRSRVAAGRVEDWFAAHGRDLDAVRLARVVLAPANPRSPESPRSPGLGSSGLGSPGLGNPDDFLADVERAFAAGLAVPGEVFVTARRPELAGEIGEEAAEVVLSAAPGTLAGPFPTALGDLTVKVLAVEPAVLDDAVRDLVERRIFAEWIERRRRAAKIEWFWGTAERTGGTRENQPER